MSAAEASKKLQRDLQSKTAALEKNVTGTFIKQNQNQNQNNTDAVLKALTRKNRVRQPCLIKIASTLEKFLKCE